VRCFILPHPGLDIPKKSYNGEVEKIAPLFRNLLNHFAREVFGPDLEVSQGLLSDSGLGLGGVGWGGRHKGVVANVAAPLFFVDVCQPKRIHKRDLTAPELREYLVTYVRLFQSGDRFPEAKTMLEATASANNQNARQLATNKYRAEMDKFVGPGVHDYRKVQQVRW
jgi:hypothetical protein